jgi:hypothetical protein
VCVCVSRMMVIVFVAHGTYFGTVIEQVCVCAWTVFEQVPYELDSTGFDSSPTSRVAFWF